MEPTRREVPTEGATPDEKYKKEPTPDEKYKEEPTPAEKYKEEGSPGDKSEDWERIVEYVALGAAVGAALVAVGVPAWFVGLGFIGGVIAAKMMSAGGFSKGRGVAVVIAVAMV